MKVVGFSPLPERYPFKILITKTINFTKDREDTGKYFMKRLIKLKIVFNQCEMIKINI